MDAKIDDALRTFARMVAEELVKLQKPVSESTVVIESRKLRGIPGIMDIFQCSRSKATRIKESGMIDEAITHVSGRLFLVDEQKALQAFEKRKAGRRY